MSFVAVGVTAGAGLLQAGIGLFKSHKAQNAIQNLRTPTYQPNRAISDYYQQALQRANENPYESNFYQQAQKMAGRSLATGVSALQDRHSAGMVGALVQGNNDAMQRAGVGAEGLQRQAFGQLGQAVNMQNADYQRQFEQNQEAPYEKQLQLEQAKAVAGSQMENAGFSNMFGGLGSLTQFNMLKQLYGIGGDNKKPPNTGTVQPYATYNPQAAQTGTGYSSPASGIGYISPASQVRYIDPSAYSSI